MAATSQNFRMTSGDTHKLRVTVRDESDVVRGFEPEIIAASPKAREIYLGERFQLR